VRERVEAGWVSAPGLGVEVLREDHHEVFIERAVAAHPSPGRSRFVAHAEQGAGAAAVALAAEREGG
jgi:hypothetical protein